MLRRTAVSAAAFAILVMSACDPVVSLRGQVSVEPAAFTVDDGPVQLSVVTGFAALDVINVTVLCAPPTETVVFDFETSDIACIEETIAFAELRAVTLSQDCEMLTEDELKTVSIADYGDVIASSAEAVIFEGRTTKNCNKNSDETRDFVVE